MKLTANPKTCFQQVDEKQSDTTDAKVDRNGDLGKNSNVNKTNSDHQVLLQVIEVVGPLLMETQTAIKDSKDNNSDSIPKNNGCYNDIVDSYKSSIKSDNSQSKDNKTISVMETKTTTKKNGSSSR